MNKNIDHKGHLNDSYSRDNEDYDDNYRTFDARLYSNNVHYRCPYSYYRKPIDNSIPFVLRCLAYNPSDDRLIDLKSFSCRDIGETCIDDKMFNSLLNLSCNGLEEELLCKDEDNGEDCVFTCFKNVVGHAFAEDHFSRESNRPMALNTDCGILQCDAIKHYDQSLLYKMLDIVGKIECHDLKLDCTLHSKYEKSGSIDCNKFPKYNTDETITLFCSQSIAECCIETNTVRELLDLGEENPKKMQIIDTFQMNCTYAEDEMLYCTGRNHYFGDAYHNLCINNENHMTCYDHASQKQEISNDKLENVYTDDITTTTQDSEIINSTDNDDDIEFDHNEADALYRAAMLLEQNRTNHSLLNISYNEERYLSTPHNKISNESSSANESHSADGFSNYFAIIAVGLPALVIGVGYFIYKKFKQSSHDSVSIQEEEMLLREPLMELKSSKVTSLTIYSNDKMEEVAI